uniref:Uncharacterized protein n=1 Tax=Avena sativa TaxID=4498 RepID=A0ACD6AN76_AVESA
MGVIHPFLRCCSFRCMTMTSEDGDISALLSEPSLPEELSEADFLPAILESIKSSEKEVELSPEEAAWADSCFVQTSELSDVDWGAMRKALLDSLEKAMEDPGDTTEVMQHDKGTHVFSEAELHARHVEEDTQNDDVDMEQQGSSYDDEDATEVREATDVIRGTDGHGKQTEGYTAKPDDGDELVSSEAANQAESGDSIFKVWDLGVSFSDDEDEIELIKDLKKLLRYNPEEAAYAPSSDTAKSLSEINIDELVSGLSDLSLQQTSE